MKIVVDPPKRLANLAKHGIDQSDVEHGFDFEGAFVKPTRPSPRTGRKRFLAIGRLDGRLVAVVFSPLGSEGIGLVSVRPANDTERKRYERA